jgi:sugar phosphate isomerase/epimerase
MMRNSVTVEWKFGYALPCLEDYDPAALERDLAHLADIGYHGVEFLIRDPAGLDPDRVDAIFRRSGLEPSGWRTGLAYAKDGLSFADRDAEVRHNAIERLKADIRFSAALGGAPVLVGRMQGTVDGEIVTIKQAKQWVVDAMTEAGELASLLEVPLYVEPVSRPGINYNNTVAEVLALAEAVPTTRIDLLIDTYHMNKEESCMLDSIRLAGDRIGHVHFSDVERLFPGGGCIDFAAVVQVLRDIGYRGYISIECKPEPDLLAAAEEGIRHIKGLL